MSETQHPVLVYGTLRPGCVNYPTFLGGHTVTEEDIRVNGLAMYGDNGFPYVMAGDSSITATLVTIDADSYDFVVMMLDFLEGYHSADDDMNHYERKLVTLRNKDGERVEAWVYVIEGLHASHVSDSFPLTPDGDWKKATK